MKLKYRKAVFVVVYSKTNKKIEYLLLKRILHWKGWEFPKGAINFLELKKCAVKREIKEETGLKSIKGKIKKFDYSGKYDYPKIYPDRKKIKGQTFHLFSAEVKKDKDIRIDKREHSDFEWVSFEKAIKMLKWDNQKKAIKIVNDWLKK